MGRPSGPRGTSPPGWPSPAVGRPPPPGSVTGGSVTGGAVSGPAKKKRYSRKAMPAVTLRNRRMRAIFLIIGSDGVRGRDDDADEEGEHADAREVEQEDPEHDE